MTNHAASAAGVLPPVRRIGGIAFIVLAVVCFGALDTTTKIASTAAPVLMAVWARYLVQAVVTAAVLWPGRRARLFHTRAPGHFMLIMAYTRTPVAVLTPYLYLQIGFAALGGWLVFSHVPDAWSLAGIALVAASGVFGTWLTGREALARGRQNEAQSSIAAVASADAY